MTNNTSVQLIKQNALKIKREINQMLSKCSTFLSKLVFFFLIETFLKRFIGCLNECIIFSICLNSSLLPNSFVVRWHIHVSLTVSESTPFLLLSEKGDNPLRSTGT